MRRLSRTIAIVAISLGTMTDRALTAMPHPMTRGLQAIEIACVMQDDAPAPADRFSAAYCAELSRLLQTRLPVPVAIVADAGPLDAVALPRSGIVWISSSLRFDGPLVIAQASWGSHMNQRGVSPREDGLPVSLQLAEGTAAEADARLLAERVVDSIAFVPKA